MECRIVALQCGIYSVLNGEELLKVPAKGAFRNKHIKPVVGDLIELDESKEVIVDVKERVSFLKRPCIANLDQMIIVHSLVEPEFSYHLLFKYLTYANQNGIKAKIVLTKLDKADKSLVEEIKNVFEKLNIETYFVSNKKGEGIEEVKKIFSGHISCLLGQSGVGKSSLLNSIDENFNRCVGEYSKALGRGKHKTKEVALLPFANSFIADTPGFSSLDLNLSKLEIAHYFPGFKEKYLSCFYSNCLHQKEKDCKILEAVKEGIIPSIAYENYLKLLQEGD